MDRIFPKNKNVKERKMFRGVRFLLGRRCYQVSVVELRSHLATRMGAGAGSPIWMREVQVRALSPAHGRWEERFLEGLVQGDSFLLIRDFQGAQLGRWAGHALSSVLK